MPEFAHGRPHYETVIADLGLLTVLSDYQPIVIGTPPLGIATVESDIDIACSARCLQEFTRVVTQTYRSEHNFFSTESIQQGLDSVVINFRRSEWDIEIFCQNIPTVEQWGVRHFLVEQRILLLFPDLRSKILELKHKGLKTEPAFAHAMKLVGDPYEAVLTLEKLDNNALKRLIQLAGL